MSDSTQSADDDHTMDQPSASKKRKLDMADKPAIDLKARIITVAAGEELVEFQVHEELLRSRSPFFAAALSSTSTWKESREGRVELPEDDPDAVSIYLQYLYVKELHYRQMPSGTMDVDSIRSEYTTLAHLYVLGEKLGDVHFKNEVMRRFMLKAHTIIDGKTYFPNPGVVDIVYKGTTSASLLRKLLVDDFVRNAAVDPFSNAAVDPFSKRLGSYNSEFAVNIAGEAIRLLNERDVGLTLEEKQDGRYFEAEKSGGSQA